MTPIQPENLRNPWIPNVSQYIGHYSLIIITGKFIILFINSLLVLLNYCQLKLHIKYHSY